MEMGGGNSKMAAEESRFVPHHGRGRKKNTAGKKRFDSPIRRKKTEKLIYL